MFEPRSRPAHVMRTQKGLHICRHCGAGVDEGGDYRGSPDEEDWEIPPAPKKAEPEEDEGKGLRVFAMALGKRSSSRNEGDSHVTSRSAAEQLLRGKTAAYSSSRDSDSAD